MFCIRCGHRAEGTVAEPDGTLWPTINLVYLARLAENVPEPTHPVNPAEVADVQWFPINSPPTNMAFPVQQLGALAGLHGRVNATPYR
jgi:hypothetical protein